MSGRQLSLPMALPDGASTLDDPRLEVLLPTEWSSDFDAFGIDGGSAKPLRSMLKDSGGDYVLEVGGFHAANIPLIEGDTPRNPTVTIELASYIFAFLSKTSRAPVQPAVQWSYHSLWLRMGLNPEPGQSATIARKTRLMEVADLWWRKRYLASGTVLVRRVFSDFSFGGMRLVPPPENDGAPLATESDFLPGVQFHPDFLRAIWPDIDELGETGPLPAGTRNINYTSFASIPLMSARQLYLGLGCHAALMSDDRRYNKVVPELLDLLGWPTPKGRYRLRDMWRLFVGQGANGLLARIDGKPLLNGTLRVSLRKSADFLKMSGNPQNWNYILEAWCEGRAAKINSPAPGNRPYNPKSPASTAIARPLRAGGKLQSASGLSPHEYRDIVTDAAPLNEDDMRALASANYGPTQNWIRFLVPAKALLGGHSFRDTILEAREHATNGGAFTVGPGAKINDDLLSMVKSRAGQGAFVAEKRALVKRRAAAGD